MTDKTTIEWHIHVFNNSTELHVTSIRLTDEQFEALKPFLGVADLDDHFGSYPLNGVSMFVEAFI